MIELVPIVAVDEAPLAKRKPGPITAKAKEALRRRGEALLRAPRA